MRFLLAILLLCVPAFADPPATVTHSNGEVQYVPGHQYTDRMVDSGSYNDPENWEDGTAPTLDDNVWVPVGFTARMHGDCEAANIVCEGNLEWLDGAYLTVSSVTGTSGAKWFAGAPESPVGYSIDFYGLPFESGDTGEFGNGIVWHGHGNFEGYGYVLPEHPEDLWYWSDGVRGDSDYSVGNPGDVLAAVNLDSNSVQLRWTGEGPRPHFMLMHGSGDVSCMTIRGFGRTDKSELLSETNKVGRYAFHNHRGGEVEVTNLDRVYVADSPGWGIVNHSSHVVAAGCAVVDFYGAGLVCEAANEVGAWEDCLSIGGHSDEVPHGYYRQINNDRWHAGEGFVGAAKVAVMDCIAADVGIGFAWWNAGLSEVIGGETVKAVYSDGDPRKVAQVPQSGMEVYGYGRRGLSPWLVTSSSDEPDDTYQEFSGFVLSGGGPGSVGISQSYAGNCRFSDGVIDGAEVAVSYVNQGSWQEYLNLTVSGVEDGFYSKATNLAGVTWADSTIQATRCAMPIQASHHAGAYRVWTINNTTLDAPMQYELLYDPDETKWDDLYTDPINEVWIDGEHVLFPWQE